MGQGNREIRHPRKMRKSDPFNLIAPMSDVTNNATHSVERDWPISKRRRPLPASRVAYAGRETGSCFHRDEKRQRLM